MEPAVSAVANARDDTTDTVSYNTSHHRYQRARDKLNEAVGGPSDVERTVSDYLVHCPSLPDLVPSQWIADQKLEAVQSAFDQLKEKWSREVLLDMN